MNNATNKAADSMTITDSEGRSGVLVYVSDATDIAVVRYASGQLAIVNRWNKRIDCHCAGHMVAAIDTADRGYRLASRSLAGGTC